MIGQWPAVKKLPLWKKVMLPCACPNILHTWNIHKYLTENMSVVINHWYVPLQYSPLPWFGPTDKPKDHKINGTGLFSVTCTWFVLCELSQNIFSLQEANPSDMHILSSFCTIKSSTYLVCNEKNLQMKGGTHTHGTYIQWIIPYSPNRSELWGTKTFQ